MGDTDWGGNWVLFWWAGAMLCKSLIQFSVDGLGCVPSLLFDLRPNYPGGNEDNGDLLQKVPCTHCHTQCPPTLEQATADPHFHWILYVSIFFFTGNCFSHGLPSWMGWGIVDETHLKRTRLASVIPRLLAAMHELRGTKEPLDESERGERKSWL